MVIKALQAKAAIAEMLRDAKMWEEANKALYVVLSAKEVS